MDPTASRETLDHSIMYIFAVALQDQAWHHVKSYAPERAQRPDTVKLWHSISTVEDPRWTERYHHPDPNQRAFGGRVVITMKDGSTLEDELALADAHPAGARPFVRENYINKFKMLVDGLVSDGERDRFLDTVQRLPSLTADELGGLHVTLDAVSLDYATRDDRGIF